MQRISRILVYGALILGLASGSPSRGDEFQTIIDRAIKAHGLKGKELKTFGYRGKNKGAIHIGGMDLEFTQEVVVKSPDKFKEAMEMTVMNQKVLVTSVFNGKDGWIKVNDKDLPINKDILSEFTEAAHMMQLSQSLFLKDKSLKLSLIGEQQVNDKPAIGVRVAKEGRKDLNFHFDKATGLLAKIERRARDLQGGQEVTEDRIVLEYQDVKGRKMAKKVHVKRDGKPFLEVDVLEAQLLDDIDDSEFGKP